MVILFGFFSRVVIFDSTPDIKNLGALVVGFHSTNCIHPLMLGFVMVCHYLFWVGLDSSEAWRKLHQGRSGAGFSLD